MQKATLRRQMRMLLRKMSTEAAQHESQRVVEKIRGLPEWQEARCVALYSPLALEPDINFLWQKTLKTFCYPVVQGEVMDFYYVSTPEELIPKTLSLPGGKTISLREPKPLAQHRVYPEQIDLILVPALAFGMRGERLGHGAGYYDRYLAHPMLSAVKIGVCFALQKYYDIPVEPHDQRVDFIVHS